MGTTSRKYIHFVIPLKTEVMWRNIKQYWSLGDEMCSFYCQLIQCHCCLMAVGGFWRSRVTELFECTWSFMRLCDDKTVWEMPGSLVGALQLNL